MENLTEITHRHRQRHRRRGSAAAEASLDSLEGGWHTAPDGLYRAPRPASTASQCKGKKMFSQTGKQHLIQA
jgi:hypothetical protein